MKNVKNENGVIAFVTLLSMFFILVFLMSTYFIVSNRVKTQKDMLQQIKKIYETYDIDEAYNSYFNEGIIPIYSNDQYLSIGTKMGTNICIQEVGGKYYEFSDDATYVLMRDLVIYEEELPEAWIAPEYYFYNNSLLGKIDYNNHTVTIIHKDSTETVYNGEVKIDPSEVNGVWANLWQTTTNSDGTLSITGYNYTDTEIQEELNKTQEELLTDVTIPNKINGVQVSKVTGQFKGADYPFSGTFTISSGILINQNYFLNGCNNITKIILKDNIEIIGDYYCFAECAGLTEIEMGNNCVNTNSSMGYVFRACQNLAKITMGDNCSFLGTYPFRDSGVDEIEIICGKNTSLKLDNIASTTKKINTENATFNYLNVKNAITNGDLIVNENGYAYCTSCTISGNLGIGDNSQVQFGGTTVAEIATLGSNLKFGSFNNFTAPEIIIKSTLIPTNTWAQFQNCTVLPSKVEIDKSSVGIGTYCFGSTDIEYLIINPHKDFACANAIFFSCKKIKAVIVNLSDDWSMGNFYASIGGKINSGWLGRLGTGSFYSTPVEDTENNRLIYYSTNLTTDSSQVLDLITQAGL